MRTGLVVMLLLSVAGAFAQTDEPKGAKEMFFDPEQRIAGETHSGAATPQRTPKFDASGRRVPHSTDTAKQKILGLSYWIELADAAGTPVGPVTDERTFVSGDRIRLHFRSNASGRVLLVQLGSSGTSSVLFPDPAKGLVENQLRAGEDHVLPSPARWFRFDKTAGTETLLVLFARSQAEIDRSFPTRPIMNAEQTGVLLDLANDATGRKDLIIENETLEAAEVGTYAVSTAGKPFILQVVLKHR